MPPRQRTTKKPATATSNPAIAGGPPIRVRMYRQGLGDSFLLTFDPDGSPVHMLIDCGSLGATTTGVSLDKVIDDIIATTGGHLHLLVATHEHQDHVSGFHILEDEFKKQKIKVDHVWLAWTENPSDDLAKDIKKYKDDLGTALAGTARALTANTGSAAIGKVVQDLLGFAGDATALGAGKFAKTVNEAMNFVRTGFGFEAEYFKPGVLIEKNWLPGFRFYVLGPPYSEKALQDLGDHGSAELYHIASGLNVGVAMRSEDPSLDEAACESQMPFDIRFRLQEDDPLVASTVAEYRRTNQSWRRVDNDWLHAATDLALQLDSLTNNTSLALAIERVSDGRVLLFPADAQQGNWISWHDQSMKWAVKVDGNTIELTAADLLKRTVFYKVGHHSSHNATAKGKGLELMQREDELVAFIPVDRAVALTRNPKGSWQMPARSLYRRLLEKCRGRVVRSDLGWADDSARAKNKTVEKEFDSLADAATWTQWRQSQQRARVTINNLYVDYVLA